ncbi:MAG TPA: right-handed parallel beta-helix repeat-containing protein [Polyangia bacterium]|jgi:hypothetical protein|nr:right-handed parallel beta-helix repeat-containing protein [Polyangia bacterium]
MFISKRSGFSMGIACGLMAVGLLGAGAFGCSKSGSGATPGGTGGDSSGSGGSSGSGTGGSGISGTGGDMGSGGNGMGGNAAGTGGASMPMPGKPAILTFTATPPNLPAGGGMVTLTWNVTDADSLSIDQGVGAVTGTMTMTMVTATTIFTLSATNAHGTSTSTTAVVLGQNPATSGVRKAEMVSPTGGETFTAPASLRLIGVGFDRNVDTNSPTPGHGLNASKAQFFVDDQMVLEQAGSDAEFAVFKGYATGIAAGPHRVSIRAIYLKPDEVLDSTPMLINVVAPPTYSKTVELSADVVLTGATGYELTGTAAGRIRLNGNGHRILSMGDNVSGPLTLKYVDLFNVVDSTSAINPGINVTTSGAVTIENSIIDSTGTVQLTINGTAPASIRGNTFRSNMRQPLGQEPGPAGAPGYSFPAFTVNGSSMGAKVFAGNNVGAGWAAFENASNWLVGGDTDADSNVLIGPRVGIFMENSKNSQVRRNYSHHVFRGGWSQGSNFELGGSSTIVVEHNVIRDSSWPVRGVGCEFRYNLVVQAGHEWLWADHSNSYIHHNLFVGGDNDIAGILGIYTPKGVRIVNNTFDAQNGPIVVTAVLVGDAEMTLNSNLIMNVPKAPTVSLKTGTLTADYNLFFNPQTTNYSDNRKPAHDLGGTNGEVNPMLKSPPPTSPFDIDDSAIWQRTTTVGQILKIYRTNYTPQTGSPAIDAGDPAGGAGNDVGAIGAGMPNAADLFGGGP